MLIDSFVQDPINGDNIVGDSIKARGFAVLIFVGANAPNPLDTTQIPSELLRESNIVISMDGTVYKAE